MLVRIAIAALGAGVGVAIGGPVGGIIAVLGVCAACWPKRRYIQVPDDSSPE